jgi:cell division septum initiation protein DivIVA
MDIKEELAQLRNENRMLREQNELLKQRLGEVDRKSEPVPAFVQANKPKPVGPKAARPRPLCRVSDPDFPKLANASLNSYQIS